MSFKTDKDFQITNEEYDRVKELLKQKEFRDMFLQYMDDLQDPAYREEQEKYFAQLAKETSEASNSELQQPSLGSDRRIMIPKGEFGLSVPMETDNKKVYINICSSEYISKYETVPRKDSFSASYRMPLSLGRERKEEDGVFVYDVVFHPDTITDSRRDAFLLQSILDVSCEYVENNYKKKLMKNGDHYNVRMEKSCYGSPLAQTIRINPTHEQTKGQSSEVSNKIGAKHAIDTSKNIDKPGRNKISTTNLISRTSSNSASDKLPKLKNAKVSPGNNSSQQVGGNQLQSERMESMDRTSSTVDPHVKKLLEEKLMETRNNPSDEPPDVSDTMFNTLSNALLGESNEAPERTSLNIPGAAQKPIGKIEELETQHITPQYVIVYSGSFSMQDHVMSQVDMIRKIPEKLIVKVKLPHLSNARTIDLEVTTQNLYLTEPTYNYRLNLSLPYPVDSDEGSAKFDRKSNEMIITLPVNIPKDQLIPAPRPKFELEDAQVINMNEEYEKERQEARKRYQEKLEQEELEKQRKLEKQKKKQAKLEEIERQKKEEAMKKAKIEEEEKQKKQEEERKKREEEEALRRLLKNDSPKPTKSAVKSQKVIEQMKTETNEMSNEKSGENSKENPTPDDDAALLQSMKRAKENATNLSEKNSAYESQYFSFEFENNYISEID